MLMDGCFVPLMLRDGCVVALIDSVLGYIVALIVKEWLYCGADAKSWLYCDCIVTLMDSVIGCIVALMLSDGCIVAVLWH